MNLLELYIRGYYMPGYGISLLEEITINPTVEPPELTQDWGNRLWRAQTKACVHQDLGERGSDPTRD